MTHKTILTRAAFTLFLLVPIYLSGVRLVSHLVVATDSSSLWSKPRRGSRDLSSVLRRLSMLDPLSSCYRTLLAGSLAGADPAGGREAATAATRVSVIDPANWVLAGRCERKVDRALAAFEKAAFLDPGRPDTYLQAGLYLSDRLSSFGSRQRPLYRNLAELNLALGLSLDRSCVSDPSLCLAMASIKAEKGETGQAVFWLKRTAIGQPVDWPFAMRKLALCFKLGERVEAVSTWKEISRKLLPSETGAIEAEIVKYSAPDFGYLLADLYARGGRLGEAREKLAALVAARPNVPDYRMALGAVCERLGLDNEARLSYEKALELSPADQTAKTKVLRYYGAAGTIGSRQQKGRNGGQEQYGQEVGAGAER